MYIRVVSHTIILHTSHCVPCEGNATFHILGWNAYSSCVNVTVAVFLVFFMPAPAQLPADLQAYPRLLRYL